jgi:hypothetical protein
MQVPLAVRAQLSRLYDLPIPDQMGNVIPLAELGKFVKITQDPVLYQKDLRSVEYVVGDAVGVYNEQAGRHQLGAPIYGMLEIEDLLKNYIAPDGVTVKSYYISSPPADGHSAFEWTGEWTVTYETFRDMGLAFGAAMVLIYILVVWEFGNFIVPAVIMAPIPLTLLGIIPGHHIMGAAFTATSMIGWIALAGIIVRNSILLVDYSIHEVENGTDIKDAVILACKTRTRPILITAFALAAGSLVIIFDPIFQGMAISLLFGVMVSTLLTLVVIPLGCISIGPDRLCASSGFGGDDNNPSLPPSPITNGGGATVTAEPAPPKTPLWFTFYTAMVSMIFWFINAINGLVNTLKMVFYIVRAPFLLLGSMLSSPPKQAPPSSTKPAADTQQSTAQSQTPTEKTPLTETEPTIKTEDIVRFAPPETSKEEQSTKEIAEPDQEPTTKLDVASTQSESMTNSSTPTTQPTEEKLSESVDNLSSSTQLVEIKVSESAQEQTTTTEDDTIHNTSNEEKKNGNNGEKAKRSTSKKLGSRRGIRLKKDLRPEDVSNGDDENKKE